MKKKIVRISTLILSIGFIAAGVYFGENRDIFMKAVTICLECIGIG